MWWIGYSIIVIHNMMGEGKFGDLGVWESSWRESEGHILMSSEEKEKLMKLLKIPNIE